MRRIQARKKDKKTSWLDSLREHPVFISLALFGTIVGGIATFSKDFGNMVALLSGSTKKPSILAFGLSPSASGYTDSQELIPAASSSTIRTFSPVYPFVHKPRAVLLVSINNPKDEDLILTALIYDVEETGEVKGGPAGPLTPKGKYHHKIVHAAGRQKLALIPPFRIPAKSAESIELELTSATEGYGLGWVLRIIVETNLGNITSEKFQLYLPKQGPISGEQSALITEEQNAIKGDRRTDIDESRDQKSSEILPPMERDNIFRAVGVLDHVERLDHLDRDILLLRARNFPYEEFSEKTTATEPPVKYRDLIPRSNLRLLWQSVYKSQ